MRMGHTTRELPLYLAPLKLSANLDVMDDKRRILIVDDNPVNLFFARKLLGKLGCDAVHTAENGSHALAEFATRRYEVAVIDCNMPGMDGYALARAIRDLEEGSDSRTHLIAMTAKGTRGTRQKCIDAGMDDYVRTSIGDAQMKEILMKWLNVEAVAAANLPHIPQTMIDTSLPVDLSLLNECVGDDDEARAMAIDLFIEGAHECMVALSIAKNVREELAWKQAAHKFKGAAANFGADHLRQCCQNAEHNALAGALEKDIMFEKIDQALVAVKRYLNK